MFQSLKRVATVVLSWLFRRYRCLSLDLLKIQGVMYYVKGVQGVRQLTVTMLFAFVLIGVGFSGFLLFHAGLAVLLYGLGNSLLLVGSVLLFLGGVYVGLAVFVLRYYTDERQWMRWTGASQLVERVTRAKVKD